MINYSLSIPVGLDAAGKTTILYKLKLGEIVTTIPTIGEWTSFTQRHQLKIYANTVQPHWTQDLTCHNRVVFSSDEYTQKCNATIPF